VLITHYHDDHVGGVPQLVQRIPVGAFIDHGPNRELDKGTERGYAAFQKVLTDTKTREIVAKPGDRLPIEGLDVTVISADGKVDPDAASPGGGQPNASCKQSEIRPPDQTENGALAWRVDPLWRLEDPRSRRFDLGQGSAI